MASAFEWLCILLRLTSRCRNNHLRPPRFRTIHATPPECSLCKLELGEDRCLCGKCCRAICETIIPPCTSARINNPTPDKCSIRNRVFSLNFPCPNETIQLNPTNHAPVPS